MIEISKVIIVFVWFKFLCKGEQICVVILDVVLELVSCDGLEGFIIGFLVEKMKMSKFGVFVYFGLCEDLQIEVVWLYYNCFEQDVFYFFIKELCGFLCLEGMFVCWIKQVMVEIVLGCIYISGVVEYDDCFGVICDYFVVMVQVWCDVLECCIKQVMEVGYLCIDIEVSQMVYEMYGLILVLYYDVCFLYIFGSVECVEVSFCCLIDSYCLQGSDSVSISVFKNFKLVVRKVV